MPNPRPNILVVMTDQQRADISRREGFELDTTPFLDSLAQRGVWFNKAYTTMPICVPARVSMMTGRYPSAHRVRENRGLRHVVYDTDLFDVMKAQGYRTGLIGKNHTYLKADDEKIDHALFFSHRGPQGGGSSSREAAFDRWLHTIPDVNDVPTPFPVVCQIPYRCVSAAREWIDSLGDDRFFLLLSFPEPHVPIQAPEPYFSMFPPDSLPPVRAGKETLEAKSFEWKWSRQLGDYYYKDYDALIPRARASYYGMMRLIDDQVQRLVAFLKDRSLLDNTLIVFLSDHGDFVGEYGLLKKGPGISDVLMRIPFFFLGPGIAARPEPHPAHISLADLFPTLCHAAGAAIPKGVQGRNLYPLLTGGEYPREDFRSVYGEQGFGGLHYGESDQPDPGACGSFGEDGLGRFDALNTYSQAGVMRMVRMGRWKLTIDHRGIIELFDLERDPMETVNVYEKDGYQEAGRQMLAELATWMVRAHDPLPYPVDGYVMKTDENNYWTPHRK